MNRFELLRFWLLPPFLSFNRSAESTRWDSSVSNSFRCVVSVLVRGDFRVFILFAGRNRVADVKVWALFSFFFIAFLLLWLLEKVKSLSFSKSEFRWFCKSWPDFETRVFSSLHLIECSRFGRSSFYGALARLCWSSCNSSTWRRASFLLPAGAYRTGNST